MKSAPSLALIGLLALIPATTAFADSLKADGFKYTEGITILGLKNGKLQTTINGNEKLFNLATIDWIDLSNQPDFNQAELTRNDPDTATAFYKSAVQNINNPQLKALAERRAADLVSSAPRHSANPELFHARPSYISPSSASPSDLAAPIATAAEEKSFHSTYDAILRDAQKGSPEDKAATAELLQRRAATASPGLKGLLLLAAYDMAKQNDASTQTLAAAAQAALESLDGPSATLAEKRIAILIQMNEALPHDARYAPAAIADELFSLAESHFNSAQFKQASQDLAAAGEWAAKNPSYAARMKPRIDSFSQELKRKTDLEIKLAANPNDPDTNAAKGLAMLARQGNAADAAPYLAKSSKPQLQRLAKALAGHVSDDAARLEIAAAAEEALAVVSENDRLPIALLLQSQAQFVSTDKAASDAQKARAELFLIKADHFVDKAQIETTAKIFHAKFFGLESDGKRIVYIVDHSGSMLDNFDFLRQEVIRSIDSLQKDQAFSVVMVSEVVEVIDEPATQMPKVAPAPGNRTRKPPIPAPRIIHKMIGASDAYKKAMAGELAKFRAQGSNGDLLAPFQEAFEKAFGMRPDTIYFLTDGHFDPKLSGVIKRLNANQTVHVNTLAFINKEEKFVAELEELAKANGGKFKFVSDKDLGPESRK